MAVHNTRQPSSMDSWQFVLKEMAAHLFLCAMAAHGGEQMLEGQFLDLVEDTNGVPSLDDCALPFKRYRNNT